MVRVHPGSDRPYDSSGHFLWIGERTRQLDGAHVDFLSRVSNPIGVKLGPTTTADDALALQDKLNPEGVEGRLTFVTRMGATKIREVLPGIVEKVTAQGGPVTWVTDPMHGNTITSESGYKTRRFDDVLDEVRGFFEVHHAVGSVPGGVHVELTGDDVTEVMGGSEEIDDASLALRYETLVDPRLNHQQSLEMAFLVAEMLRSGR
jgi:3-deoxy-7-phosphoheptulonate synthase